MSGRTPGVNNTFGYPLMVEVHDLLAQMEIVQQRRAALADPQAVVRVVNGDTPDPFELAIDASLWQPPFRGSRALLPTHIGVRYAQPHRLRRSRPEPRMSVARSLTPRPAKGMSNHPDGGTNVGVRDSGALRRHPKPPTCGAELESPTDSSKDEPKPSTPAWNGYARRPRSKPWALMGSITRRATAARFAPASSVIARIEVPR